LKPSPRRDSVRRPRLPRQHRAAPFAAGAVSLFTLPSEAAEQTAPHFEPRVRSGPPYTITPFTTAAFASRLAQERDMWSCRVTAATVMPAIKAPAMTYRFAIRFAAALATELTGGSNLAILSGGEVPYKIRHVKRYQVSYPRVEGIDRSEICTHKLSAYLSENSQPNLALECMELNDVRMDRVVLENLPLVKAIAVRVYENLGVHVDLDDLVRTGVLGLLDAATKFDPDKEVVFPSYAKHRIKGAILDSLQPDWASLGLRHAQD
jgi:hypothetical protein